MAEFLTLPQAIERYVADGKSVALEGFTHLIPHAAAHEIIRKGQKDLTLIRMTPDMIYDQLIGMGQVGKLVFSYAGNPGVGLLRRLRDAVENQWPRPLEIVEHSHAAMAHAYEAGASQMPCAFMRGYKGAELKDVNPNIKTINCPFTGEELAAFPALNPDVGIIHAHKADRKGNVLLEGIVGVQKECILAAKNSIVTVEEVVDSLGDVHPNACVLPGWAISAIAEVPGGAHPSYVHGVYDRDNATYVEWDKISADRELFQAWMLEHVLDADPSIFATRVEGLRK